MNQNQQNEALPKKTKELSKSLEKEELKVALLETMIKFAEEDKQINIRKINGTKQLKE